MADSIYAPRNDPVTTIADEDDQPDTPPPHPFLHQPLLYVSRVDPAREDKELASGVFQKFLPVRWVIDSSWNHILARTHIPLPSLTQTQDRSRCPPWSACFRNRRVSDSRQRCVTVGRGYLREQSTDRPFLFLHSQPRKHSQPSERSACPSTRQAVQTNPSPNLSPVSSNNSHPRPMTSTSTTFSVPLAPSLVLNASSQTLLVTTLASVEWQT